MLRMCCVLLFAWHVCYAWMDQAIEKEFAPFAKQGISKKSIEETWALCKKDSNFHRFKIIHGKVYGPKSTMKNLLHVLVQLYPMADVDLIHYQGDIVRGDLCNKPKLSAPILVSAKPKGSQKFVLFIDWYFDVFGTAELGWNNLASTINANWNRFPWECKTEKLFWRGAVTDGCYTTDRWHCLPRGNLVLQSKQNPDLIDASFIVHGGDRSTVQAAPEIEFTPFVHPVDHMPYKYQMDVDGVTCTWPGLQWKLLSGCLVMKQNSSDTMWYHCALEPWVHYIPVEKDLSDLQDKIRWAKAHDLEAQRIAAAGREFVQTYLTCDQILLYCFKVLARYAALQTFRPTVD